MHIITLTINGTKDYFMHSGTSYTSIGIARTNGIEIAYQTFGRHGDIPVLMIMGLSSQMILWEDAFCLMLAEKGFNVVRFDNRDIGLSTKLSTMGMPHIQALLMGRLTPVPYTLLDMAKDSIGLLDALGIERAHVVGASMGGMIGQEMAISYPGRIRTLTSIMSTTGNPLLPPPSKEALEILFRPIPTAAEPYVDYFRAVWRILSGKSYPIDDATATRLGEETFRRGVEPAGNARQLAAILASGSRKERLASVKSPSLVIHGTEDPLVPLACGIDTAESISGARLKVLDGMGHFLPNELWKDIIGAIEAHISLS